MKITIITVVYNAEKYLRDCIESVLRQDYQNTEYILIDGSSVDDSYRIALQYKERISILFSEPDKGMYDALNKGLALATGDVIGILNADDMLAAEDVISQVARVFEEKEVDAVYGDLNYVDPHDVSKIQRKWRSFDTSFRALVWGWMPAHPTLYIKARCFKTFGGYQLNYGSAADYELMLRFLYHNRVKMAHLPALMVNMRNGGMSNSTLNHRYSALKNDYRALRDNRVPFPLLALTLKKIRKIKQFF